MVYCGKASQGCQNCRQRRIKCDKVKPECSQCIRIGKKCPGYRDQLSLMFRDESSKVIQKAHAQWGTAGSPTEGQSSSATTASSSASWISSPNSSSTSETRSPPAESPVPSGIVVLNRHMEVLSPKIYTKIEPTIEQRGMHFFIQRYLMSHPDAPQATEQLALYNNGSAAMQSVMVAVGLAGLSNIRGDKAMNLLSRQKYTAALKQTGQIIAIRPSDPLAVMSPLRAVVTLALFEVVQGKGSKLSTGTANIHISGAIALLRMVLPASKVPAGGARAVLQLLFSLFIPSQLTETPLPPEFFDILRYTKQLLPVKEHCCCDIAVAIAKFLHISTLSKDPRLMDGHPQTEKIFQQLLGMDAVLARLEEQWQAACPYTVEQTDFPREALFRGKYHTYPEIEGARIWNHLRWVRILVVQRVLEMSDEFPLSSSRVVLPAHRNQCFSTASRMAEDIITSTPSQWHHPALSSTQTKKVAASGKGGTGAVGLPALLWHLKIAGCAPGVPQEFWDWAHKIAQVVWKTMGMQHALALSEVMEGHRAGMEKEAIDRILKIEDEDW